MMGIFYQEKPMVRSAIISDCQKFRYVLTRDWKEFPRLLVAMLNPSKADHKIDDPTVRKCIGFARRWNMGRLDVVNLYAFRATDPRDLVDANYPVGEENDRYIANYAMEASVVVVAWGTHALKDREEQVLKILRESHRCDLYCLGRTKDGFPRHPLMVSYDTVLEKY